MKFYCILIQKFKKNINAPTILPLDAENDWNKKHIRKQPPVTNTKTIKIKSNLKYIFKLTRFNK